MKGFQSCSVLSWLAHTPPIVLLFSPQYCGLEGYSTKEILQKVLDFDSIDQSAKPAHCVPAEGAAAGAGRCCGKHLQPLVILLSSYMDNKLAGQEFNF